MLIHKQASHFTVRSYPNRNPATGDCKSVGKYLFEMSKNKVVQIVEPKFKAMRHRFRSDPQEHAGQEGWLGCLANLIVTKTAEKFLLTESALIQFRKDPRDNHAILFEMEDL